MMSRWAMRLCFAAVVLCLLVTSSFAVDVTLEWDANKEPRLSSYEVCYKTDKSEKSYNGLGASEGNSPIRVKAADVTRGDVCRYRLSGLSDIQTYWFVVRAVETMATQASIPMRFV